MMNTDDIKRMSLKDILNKFPSASYLFEQYGITPISFDMPFEEAVGSVSKYWLRDNGLTFEGICEDIIAACKNKKNDVSVEVSIINSITICGGKDKSGMPEKSNVTITAGETICICGATGSGKTRLLEDIEYVANGDSPTGRTIMINNKIPSEDERLYFETQLCSRLSQTMNFVMDLSCREFIETHLKCRNPNASIIECESLIQEIMNCANTIAGENFNDSTMLTELSGGQSRAFMVADMAYISDSPVILIDEPENAGIDGSKVLSLLVSKGKTAFVSTHDPVIALSCDKRIVIKNGAISAEIKRTESEVKLLELLKAYNTKINAIRDNIRNGKIIDMGDIYV